MKEVNYQKVKSYQRQGPSKQPHDSGADIPPVNKIPYWLLTRIRSSQSEIAPSTLTPNQQSLTVLDSWVVSKGDPCSSKPPASSQAVCLKSITDWNTDRVC